MIWANDNREAMYSTSRYVLLSYRPKYQSAKFVGFARLVSGKLTDLGAVGFGCDAANRKSAGEPAGCDINKTCGN